VASAEQYLLDEIKLMEEKEKECLHKGYFQEAYNFGQQGHKLKHQLQMLTMEKMKSVLSGDVPPDQLWFMDAEKGVTKVDVMKGAEYPAVYYDEQAPAPPSSMINKLSLMPSPWVDKGVMLEVMMKGVGLGALAPKTIIGNKKTIEAYQELLLDAPYPPFSLSSMDVHFQNNKNDWGTPWDLYFKLAAKFGPFDLDVCASEGNAKAPIFFTEQDNGLKMDWFGKCWMNPPYNQVGKFVDKAIAECEAGRAERVVMLVAARPDTKWWLRMWGKAHLVAFLHGRVKFEGAPNSAPFPSAVVVLDPTKTVPEPKQPVFIWDWKPKGAMKYPEKPPKLKIANFDDLFSSKVIFDMLKGSG